MSRIGRKPINIPAGVTVSVSDDNTIIVKGPKGELTKKLHQEMQIEVEGAVVSVKRPSDSPRHRALHGLTRTLISNMVEGVVQGYSKDLEIVGTGYRVQKQGNGLVFNLGYSHPVEIPEIKGITFDVTGPTTFKVSGADKQQVGQVAAEIREKRPPEPYHGKGIRYVGEYVRHKEGKAGKK